MGAGARGRRSAWTGCVRGARGFRRQSVFDLVKLEGISAKPRKSFGAKLVDGSPPIFLMETVSSGAAVYALTRQGAEKLLRITVAMNREADFFIRHYGATGLVVGEFRPFPVQQNRADSFIGSARQTDAGDAVCIG